MEEVTLTLPDATKRAFAEYSAGNFTLAAEICSKILCTKSDHFDATHLLAVLRAKKKEFADAERLYAAALRIRPDNAEVWNNSGVNLQAQKRFEEAAANFSNAVELRPNYLDAWNNLGLAQKALNRSNDALHSFSRALEIDPEYISCLSNRGNIYSHLGRFAEAISDHTRAVELNPKFAEGYNNRGSVYLTKRRMAKALEEFDRAIEVREDYFEAWSNRGIALQHLERWEEAIASYDRALAINPLYADGWNNRAVALQELKRSTDALASADRAIDLRPQYPEAFYNRGITLRSLNRFIEAEASYKEALRLRANYPEAHTNLGNVYRELNRPFEAIDEYRKSIRLRPEDHVAWCHLGTVLHETAQPEEAAKCFEASLARKPDYVDGHWNRALIHLMQGNLAEGWDGYESRRQKKDIWQGPTFPGTEWNGDMKPGTRVFVYAEQGLGDTLQFVRFAYLLAEKGLKIIINCPRRLHALLEGRENVEIIKQDGKVVCDFHVPMMSIPWHIKAGMADLCTHRPAYLYAEPARVRRWSKKLPQNGFRVGIVWQGSPEHDVDRGRSFPLAMYEPIARIPGVHLISLQKNAGAEQVAALNGRFPVTVLDDFDEGPDAFLDTAAVMMNCELIITSDTSVAHLAGGLGRPIWMALKRVPDWRWFADRPDSPWYPSMRLFRQKIMGDWTPVFDEIARELSKLVAQTMTPGVIAPPTVPNLPAGSALAPIGFGELNDKITILEIKNERLTDEVKKANVLFELDLLSKALAAFGKLPADFARINGELKAVNEILWDIEDRIRDCERAGDFGPTFIELARKIYFTNDQRAALKRQLNDLVGSAVIEEKSYVDYA